MPALGRIKPGWMGGSLWFEELYTLLHGFDLAPDCSLIPDPIFILQIGRARPKQYLYRPLNECPNSRFKNDEVGICPHFEKILLVGSNLLGITEELFLDASAFCGCLVAREDVTALSQQGIAFPIAVQDSRAPVPSIVVERFLPVKACEVIWRVATWANRRRTFGAKEAIDALESKTMAESTDHNYEMMQYFMQNYRIYEVVNKIEDGAEKLLRQDLALNPKSGWSKYPEEDGTRLHFFMMYLLDSLHALTIGDKEMFPICERAPERLELRCERRPIHLLVP